MIFQGISRNGAFPTAGMETAAPWLLVSLLRAWIDLLAKALLIIAPNSAPRAAAPAFQQSQIGF